MIEIDSKRWANVISAGLGASLDCVRASRNIQVTIFKVGPFRIAYPDFPVGAFSYTKEDIELIFEICRMKGVAIVRLHSQTKLNSPQADYLQSLKTVQILDLQAWNESSLKKPRRTKSRAVRSEVDIVQSSGVDGKRLYELYVGTINRNSGRFRYTRKYFDEIADVGCFVAVFEGKIIGFVCLGISGYRACYLHGGYDPVAKSLYPSDLLFRTMILEARNSGAKVLDFLPSPAGQSSLDRYKMAWGAVQRPFFVMDFHLEPVRAKAFSYLRSAVDKLPKFLRDLSLPRI